MKRLGSQEAKLRQSGDQLLEMPVPRTGLSRQAQRDCPQPILAQFAQQISWKGWSLGVPLGPGFQLPNLLF